ncbi:MAG: SDR family NAD(P)-dependent oxidoreductase [Bacteroidia bacterium]|nr:SDR family NAD(P)-dependent oxidoreductase [Bacteroidia bacterium]
MKNNEFRKKNIVLTGATGGLGSFLSKEFFKRGANLLLIGRNEQKLQSLANELNNCKDCDQNIELACIDLSKRNIESEIASAMEKIHSIDILINNAATHGPVGVVWENEKILWEKAFQVNFYAPFELIRCVIPKMIKNNTGKIINIAGGGATANRPYFSSYAIAKTALVRLTELVAEELKGYNIQVNAISPGTMPTNLLKEILGFSEETIGKKEIESAKKSLKEKGSIKRAANLCIFLASDKSNGITGKLISAVWDPWPNIIRHQEELNSSDIYTLRRIVPEDRSKKWD